MNLEQKINEEMKAALKSGDKLRLETIRSIRAGIIEFQKSGSGRDMNEADELKILQSARKKRLDAIPLYEKAGRQELIDNEKQELAIIEEFLPMMMSDDEIANVISKIIKELSVTDAKEMGKVMGAAMKQLQGKADGSKVQQIVRQLLSQLDVIG